MIAASRLCRPEFAVLSGIGGLYRSGRWHEQGHRIVYAAESEALAALEALVHLPKATQLPEYVCVKVDIPPHLIMDVGYWGALPSDWFFAECKQARRLGTRWIEERPSAVLRVPSVVIPRESNFMLNPLHPDFPKIIVHGALPFEFDIRLLGRLQ